MEAWGEVCEQMLCEAHSNLVFTKEKTGECPVAVAAKARYTGPEEIGESVACMNSRSV